jgi:hypothetical protein
MSEKTIAEINDRRKGGASVASLLTGVFADFLAPFGMNQTYMTEHLCPPSASFSLAQTTRAGTSSLMSFTGSVSL